MKFKVGDLVYSDLYDGWSILTKHDNKNTGHINREIVDFKGTWFYGEDGFCVVDSSYKLFTVDEMTAKGIYPNGSYRSTLPMQNSTFGSMYPSNQELKHKVSSFIHNDVKPLTKDGLCPQCGELGKYIALAPVCSKHGPY